MKQYISWEHYEADRSKTGIKDFIGFGLVFFGTLTIIGIAILIL